ncbi:Ku protein [Pseudokineococcus marinus]|uniref:Non-homologous end joining protein Ku n=1 Tax=Pseudokineococcus marinus TaxID=351215 RepID=A0A849BLN9_9ACTN|nr:Ku protein [Pseudokineococcus marinus]NNH24189.1 Ku protein [Pseudokineococcus marinus]
MRAIWKGAVSFGLVSVPVKVYAATGTNDVRFHQVHEADGGRIRYKRVCSVDGEEVSYPEIAKAYETADGEQVVLTDEDLDQLPLSTSREIDVVEFVPSEQVDPVLFNKAYYLEPERTALKPYTLLREALRATDRVAVVKVALRQRESLAILRVRDDVISLQTLLWPDEVREASFDVLSSEVELRPQETTMAASLVESLAGDFDPDAFSDGYAAAVTELVEAKISAGEVRRPPAEGEEESGEGAQVVDLLSALQRSVDRARRDRGEEPAEEAPAPAPRRSRRRTPPAEEPAEDAGDDAAQEAPAPRRRRTASSAEGTSSKGAASKGTAAKETASKGTAKDSTSGGAKGRSPAKGTASKGTASKGTASKGTAAKSQEEEAAPARRTRKKSA